MLLAICVLTLVVVIVQREFLRHLNRKKDVAWKAMTVEQQTAYQNDILAREKDGNKRLDFRFSY